MAFRGAGEPGDDAFRADVFVRPFGLVSAPHVHDDQEERLHVLSGHLRYRFGRVEQPLGARQTVSIPARVRHVWWNDGDVETHVVLELRPAHGSDALFDVLFRLAREGKTDEHGVPGPLRLALLAERHGYYPGGVPLAIQRPFFSTLAAIARRLGYRAAAT